MTNISQSFTILETVTIGSETPLNVELSEARNGIGLRLTYFTVRDRHMVNVTETQKLSSMYM